MKKTVTISSILATIILAVVGKVASDSYEHLKKVHEAGIVALQQQTQNNKDTLGPIVMWLVQHDKEQDSVHAGWRKKRHDDSVNAAMAPVSRRGSGSYKKAYDLMKK